MEQIDTSPRHEMAAQRRKMEIIIGLIIILLAIAAIIVSNRFPGTGLATDVGSARFPQIYASVLIALCALLIAGNLMTRNKDEAHPVAPEAALGAPPGDKPDYRKTALGIISSVACLAALPTLGYAMTTTLYLSFLMWLLGMRHRLWTPLLAALITAVLYFTFSAALNVPLPVGSLFE